MTKRLPYMILFLAVLIMIGYYMNTEARYVDLLAAMKNTESRFELPDMRESTITLDIPDSMTFAGEEVPLHIPDVRERLDREIHINRYWHNNSIFLIKRANRWLPQIEEILVRNGIPSDFKYLPAIEGGLQNAISPKKAVGFWQILKPTAREYGMEVSNEVDERYDPLKSTEVACKYLKQSYKKFGDWTLVAASFNRGMRGIQNSLDDQQVDNYYDLLLNEETSRYVFRILACKDLLENPAKYNFDIKKEHLYTQEELDTIRITESISDLAAYAKDLGINYKILKRHNPWLRRNTLNVSGGKSYLIRIPKNN
jgi:hypothetical protein